MKKSLLVCLWMMLGLLPCSAELYYSDATVCGIQHNERYVYFCRPAGVSVLEKATGRWTAYTKQNGMLPVDKHYSITLHHDTLLVGGEEGWVTAIRDDWKESRQYETVQRIWGDERRFPVTKIVIDEQGHMALLYYIGIDVVIDSSHEEQYIMPGAVVTDHGSYLYDAVFDGVGNLWIVGDIDNAFWNLSRYSFGGELDCFLSNLEKPWPFKFGETRCVAVDADKNVWFTPGGQLVVYNGTTYTTYEMGFVANDMEFDAQGRLWLAEKKGGLCCFDHGEIIRYPYQQDTFQCLDIDGDVIYIGTQNGVLKFENGEITPFELPDLSTGITPTLASPENSQPATMFTLGGTAVTPSSRMTKGVYIQNGRKKIK